jgi:hypothetical protein
MMQPKRLPDVQFKVDTTRLFTALDARWRHCKASDGETAVHCAKRLVKSRASSLQQELE